MAAELTLEKRFAVKLDIKRSASNREFEVVEGDTGNVIDIALTDDGAPVDMTGYRVMAVFSKSDGTSCQDSENGTVLIEGNRATIPPVSFFVFSRHGRMRASDILGRKREHPGYER